MLNPHPGAAYGWRARIGLLQPTMVSDTNPYEFYLMAPEGVQMVLTSLGIRGVGSRRQEYADAMEHIEEPIRRVLSRGVDAIVQAGVPPIVTRGWGYEAELLARVRTITDVPFDTDVSACIAGFQALGVARVAVLASESMLDGMADYFTAAGIEVVASSTARPGGGEDPSADSLSVAFQGSVALKRAASRAQGIYIPGANRPTVGMLATLEAQLGIPVVSSAQAIMWRGLQLAGVDPKPVTGYGRLFQAG